MSQNPTLEQITLLALCRPRGIAWSLIAREAQRPGGLERLVAAKLTEVSDEAEGTRALLTANRGALDDAMEKVATTIRPAMEEGARLTTVLDDDYPLNLRAIVNLPPFLFYRGDLRPDDTFAVAVVGTRHPTDLGLERAAKMARRLMESGVTVLSGLAAGIDTAAHEATLSAGGRPVAVVGTGIRNCYPPQNADLSRRVAEAGAVVSQFWPDAPRQRGASRHGTS